MSYSTCSVDALKRQLEGGSCCLVDVREYPEYVESHIPGSRLIPLGELRKNPGLVGNGGEVFLLCRTGRRAREAAELLCAHGGAKAVVVEGGIEAWKHAGYPTRRERGPISLERQVRIAAGALVTIGLLLDTVLPGARLLSYFVGAGLIFAGVTNTCAMGLLLAKLPWNRPRAGIDSSAGQ